MRLPASSLELDVNAVRDRIESLDAVERARVRALASGVLEIRAIERVPVVVWRSAAGLELLDQNGVRVAEVDSRLRRPDLPLIAGEGAEAHVPEALALLAETRAVAERLRGLVRVGERRWDLVLDRGQVVKLPEADPVLALRRVMALDAAEQLFARDLSVRRHARSDAADAAADRARDFGTGAAEGRRQGRGCMRRQLYEVQRAMRARRETALRRGVIAVLDIGTSKVACLVLQFVPEEVGEGMDARPVLTQGAFRVIGAANTRSRGMAFGEIASMEEAERAVMTAIQGAQKMAGLRVDHVIVSFSGGRPRSYGCTGEVEVEHGAVAERDIGHVLAACEIPDYGHDREALHALPVNFALDERTGLTDPRGQIGRDLACDMHLVTVGSTPLRNILHCIRRCDLELGGIVVSSYASGLASAGRGRAGARAPPASTSARGPPASRSSCGGR